MLEGLEIKEEGEDKIEEEEIKNSEEVSEKERTLGFVTEQLQKCSQMGSNDYEIPALQKIIDDVKADKMPLDEARKRAQEIYSSKQDYH